MPNIPPDPFLPEELWPKSQRQSEFGWGMGMHPDPEHSEDYDKGQIPYSPPSRDDDVRTLQAYHRMNTNDPIAQPDPYVAGNPDRYGPQKPLVRERGYPTLKRPACDPTVRFRRAE